MAVLLIPYLLLEFYISLKMGENIGFMLSVIWIVLSMMLGFKLLQASSLTMMGNLNSMRSGKLSMKRFENASSAYLVAALFLIIPGVLSDFLGLIALAYTVYLQFVAKITPEQTNTDINYTNKGNENVIDVEIIDEYDRSDRSS